MCGGQHRDLVWAEPNLNQFWEIAAAKSGSFFSIACSGGARLATDEAARINGFSRFGHHLGILIQLFDDLEDLRYIRECRTKNRWTNLDKTLPFIYAREVLPASQYIRLQKCMKDSDGAAEAAEEVFEFIDGCGTALYINVEIERHREEALAGLAQAEPLTAPGEKLVDVLGSITPT
jgi:geranylgeranyl pyrophosphate synthase